MTKRNASFSDATVTLLHCNFNY